MRITSVGVLVCLLPTSACVYERGASDRDIAKVMEPKGMRVFLRQEGGPLDGELLGFRGDTAFVLVERRLYAAHRTTLTAPDNVGTWPMQAGLPSDVQRRARYPNGVSHELETALLARLRQTASLR